MHIPDGFLNPQTALAAAVLSAGGVGAALHQVRAGMPRRKIPLMGLTSAFVFAAQMLNFPVAAGTSGHLMGGVLAAVLLGPAPAVLVMTCVLLLQCLLFADGGLLALGANVFNMAVVAPVAGYAVYRGVRRVLTGESGRLAAVAFASWCSTVLAAVCCAGELASSGTSPWSAVFPAMVNVHVLIGVGEAIINSLVIASLARSRPELLENGGPSIRWSGIAVWVFVLVLGVAVFVSPFASPWPDGLQKVASRLGFAGGAPPYSILAAPIPDYRVSGLASPVTATILAVGLGTIAAFVFSIFLARALVRKPDGKSVST
ncbi:MAG: energy-coupling factor ABC transporter permease [Pseudomonadota bacterium]